MADSQDSNWFKRALKVMSFAEDVQAPEPSSLKEVVFVKSDNKGSTGTKSFSGYNNEDYLAELRGHRRAELIDKIRRSDPTIIMLLSSIKNLIKSAVWEVEPGDDSEEAKADAELMKHIFFKDMRDPWDQYLNEALTCIEFGHAVFERTHKIVQNHPKFGSYVGIKALGWRSPRTIERWNLNPESGDLLSVTQIAYGDLARYVDMDARYLTVITMNKEGSNYEGISMLRPVYGCYLRKNTYMKLNAIGVEKFAIPTPVVEVPEVDLNSEQFNNMTDVLENFVGHESQYITYPVGWKVTLVSNTYDPEKVEKSVDAEDRRMVNAFLANFLNLGQGSSGGSYALSNDLSDFFMAGLDYIANLIVEDINRTIIPELIKMNKGDRQVYPRIIHSGISDKAGKELAETLNQLATGQYIIPDDKLESYLRQKYNLPKASDEGQRIKQDPQQPPQSLFKPQLPMSENSLYRQIKLAEQKRLEK